MPTKLQTMWTALQSSVFKKNYFVKLWLETLAQHNMSTASIDQHEHSDRQIVLAANTFWDKLPDHPKIRKPEFELVFLDLCDIAEHIFD